MFDALEAGDQVIHLCPDGPAQSSLRPDTDEVPRWAARLFCEGARELTFLKGMTRAELARVCEALGADLAPGDRMLPRLKALELPSFLIYAVDVLGDGLSAEDGVALAARRSRARESGASAAAPFRLSEADLNLLCDRLALPWLQHCAVPPPKRAPGSVRAWVGADEQRRQRLILRACRALGVLPPAIAARLDRLARQKKVDTLARSLTGLIRGAVTLEAPELVALVLSRDRMLALVPLLEEHADTLVPVLAERAAALPRDSAPLVAVLQALSAEAPRERLRKACVAGGVDLTDYFLGLLASDDLDAAVAALDALQASPQVAQEATRKALLSPHAVVRRAALDAAQAQRVGAELLPYVGRLLRDPDDACRGLATQIFHSSPQPGGDEMLLSAIKSPAFAALEEAEQRAFYRALGRQASPLALCHLRRTILVGRLLSSAEEQKQMLLEIEGLAQMGTRQAIALLAQTAERWRLPAAVRDAARAAIVRSS